MALLGRLAGTPMAPCWHFVRGFLWPGAKAVLRDVKKQVTRTKHSPEECIV